MENKDILDLIKSLNVSSGLYNPVEHFTNGYCLLFAKTLKDKLGCGEILYLPDYFHFVLLVDGCRLYDASGNVTSTYKMTDKIRYEDVPDKIISQYRQ